MSSKSRHVKPVDAGGLLDREGRIVPGYVPAFEASVLPYCTWYQDDFLGAVRGMKAAEIGIYAVLLNEMYERGEAIDMPPDRLARLCGTTKKTLLATLEILVDEGRIIELDCGLWNVRVQKIFVQRRKNSASNSEAGKKSAEKRNEIKGGGERPLNGGSAAVQPNPEAQKRDIGGGGSAGAREHDPPDKPTDREVILEAIGADPISGIVGPNGVQLGSMADMQEARRWSSDLALSQSEVLGVIAEVMAAKADGPPRSFSYFTPAMERFAGAKARPALTPINGEHHEPNRPRDPGGFNPSSTAGRAHQNLAAAFARSISGEPGGG